MSAISSVSVAGQADRRPPDRRTMVGTSKGLASPGRGVSGLDSQVRAERRSRSARRTPRVRRRFANEVTTAAVGAPPPLSERSIAGRGRGAIENGRRPGTLRGRMDAAGAAALRLRIEQHQHWLEAGTVRDGVQEAHDPHARWLLEIHDGLRVYADDTRALRETPHRRRLAARARQGRLTSSRRSRYRSSFSRCVSTWAGRSTALHGPSVRAWQRAHAAREPLACSRPLRDVRAHSRHTPRAAISRRWLTRKWCRRR